LNSALIPFMQTVVTFHALLLSIGTLILVNLIRHLSGVQEKAWEIYLDAKERGVSIVDIPERNKRIERVKGFFMKMWILGFAIGSIGILLALVSIAGSLEWSIAFPLSNIPVIAHLTSFAFFSFVSVRGLGWWLMKAP